MLKAIEKALLLQELELLQFASADHLMQLAEVCHEETCKAGDTLFRSGEPATKLYLLVSGKAAYDGLEGQPLEKTALNLWQCLAGAAHPAICRCLTDGTVLTLATEDLLDLFAGESEFSLALLRYLASKHLGNPA
jgi:CRP-like cAMP-binding protein